MKSLIGLTTSQFTNPDRRRNRRFPLTLRVRYSTIGGSPPLSGSGCTIDISSCGVYFTTEALLPEGRPVQLAIDWPASIEGVQLQLVTRGMISRSEPGLAAMLIQVYEFRTRGGEVIPL